MMCGHPGCPHRVMQTSAGLAHVDTHGVPVTHTPVTPEESPSE